MGLDIVDLWTMQCKLYILEYNYFHFIIHYQQIHEHFLQKKILKLFWSILSHCYHHVRYFPDISILSLLCTPMPSIIRKPLVLVKLVNKFDIEGSFFGNWNYSKFCNALFYVKFAIIISHNKFFFQICAQTFVILNMTYFFFFFSGTEIK